MRYVMVLRIIALMAVIAFTNCGGSSTGVVDQLIDAICNKVNSCNSFSKSDCVAGMESVNLSDELGLEEDFTTTMADIRTEISNGTITVNTTVQISCIDSINATDCANVFDVSSTDDLFNTEEFVGSDCGEDEGTDALLTR